MKKAIQNYFERVKEHLDYYANEDFSKVCIELKNKIDNDEFLIERRDQTDLSLFEKEFGYKLPSEIEEYINLFWHPYISGCYNTKEAIVLFSVLKEEGDSADDILYYENSLITMAKEWKEIGDIQKYIPIGWLGHSGGYVLYEVGSNNVYLENMDVDGEVEEKPIAHSLKELINGLYLNPLFKEGGLNK